MNEDIYEQVINCVSLDVRCDVCMNFTCDVNPNEETVGGSQ